MTNAFKNLRPTKQEEFRKKAEYLIERGYVQNKTVDELAKEIYNKSKDESNE